ncbi:MAG: 6-pyruvoyl-tetrahydropterin synthase-related protein [Patescibacteria group bacterium]|jgi:hypothetical protein
MKPTNQKIKIAKSRASLCSRHGTLLAGLIFIILAIISSWSVLANVSDKIVGETDAFQLLGTINSLSKTWSPADLLTMSGLQNIFSVTFPLLLLHKIFGDPLGYNIFWIASFALTGFGTYLLTYYMFRKRSAAYIAGGIFSLAPIHFALSAGFHGIGHLELYPFAILLLFKLLNRPSVKYLLGLVAFILLISSYDIHGAVFIGLFSIIYVVYETIRRPKMLKDRRLLVYMGIFAALCGLWLVFHTKNLVKVATSDNSYNKPSVEEIITYSNDAAGFVTPYAYHPIWGDFFWQNYSSKFIRSIGENTNYIGIVTFILVIVGIYSGKKLVWIKYWLGITIAFSILSLGPFLKLGGIIEPKIPLPYLLLLKYIPFIDNLRGVGRFYLLGMLGFSILAGYGFSVLYVKLKYKKKYIFTFLVVVLGMLDFLAVPKTNDTSVPKFYTQIAAESGNYSILQIPSVTSYNPSSYLVYYNSQHDKQPLAEKGYFSRDQYDNERLDWLRKTPVLGNLLYSLPQGQTPDLDVVRQDYPALAQTIFRENNLKYIILHKNFITDNPYIGYGILPENFELTKHFIEDTLKLSKYYEDNDTLVYLAMKDGSTETGASYVRLGNNWQTDKDPVTWKPFALGGQDSSLVAHNSSSENKLVGVTFQAQSEDENYRVSLKYQDKLIDTIDIGPDPITYTVNLPNVPTGDSSLSFSLPLTDNGDTQSLNQVIKLLSVKYAQLSDVTLPIAYDILLQQPDNRSVLQVGYRNLYTTVPQTGDQAKLGNHKVVQMSDADYHESGWSTDTASSSIRNHPIIRYMQNDTYYWGWAYNNEKKTYNDLYWYYLTTNNLLEQNIGYVMLDKKLFSSGQIAYSKLYFQNALSTSKLFEDDASVLYQISPPQQSVETHELMLNGAFCDVYNVNIKDGDELSLIESQSDAIIRLTGRLNNPTPENRTVYFTRGEEYVGRYILYPGDNEIVLTIGRLTEGINTLTFSVEFGQSGESYRMSDWATLPTDYTSFIEYVKSQNPAQTESVVDSYENPAVVYDESSGKATTDDSYTARQSFEIKPACAVSKESPACTSIMTHYFDGYTTSAEASAWIKMDAWPEGTTLSLKLINNDGMSLNLKTPYLGLGWSPTVSGEFEHSFQLGKWNNLRVVNTDSGELTLYENDVPIFWCAQCAQSRILGVSINLESNSPQTKAWIDDLKYGRTYLK